MSKQIILSLLLFLGSMAGHFMDIIAQDTYPLPPLTEWQTLYEGNATSSQTAITTDSVLFNSSNNGTETFSLVSPLLDFSNYDTVRFNFDLSSIPSGNSNDTWNVAILYSDVSSEGPFNAILTLSNPNVNNEFRQLDITPNVARQSPIYLKLTFSATNTEVNMTLTDPQIVGNQVEYTDIYDWEPIDASADIVIEYPDSNSIEFTTTLDGEDEFGTIEIDSLDFSALELGDEYLFNFFYYIDDSIANTGDPKILLIIETDEGIDTIFIDAGDTNGLNGESIDISEYVIGRKNVQIRFVVIGIDTGDKIVLTISRIEYTPEGIRGKHDIGFKDRRDKRPTKYCLPFNQVNQGYMVQDTFFVGNFTNDTLDCGDITLTYKPDVSYYIENSCGDLIKTSNVDKKPYFLNNTSETGEWELVFLYTFPVYDIWTITFTIVTDNDCNIENNTLTIQAGCCEVNGVTDIHYKNIDKLPNYTYAHQSIQAGEVSNSQDYVTIKSNRNITFEVDQFILLEPGFSTEKGSVFCAQQGVCDSEEY